MPRVADLEAFKLTKLGTDEWSVRSLWGSLKIRRGRYHGPNDRPHLIYMVQAQSQSGPLAQWASEQWRLAPYGFTRLMQAVEFAAAVLEIYDEAYDPTVKVNPKRRKKRRR